MCVCVSEIINSIKNIYRIANKFDICHTLVHACVLHEKGQKNLQ